MIFNLFFYIIMFLISSFMIYYLDMKKFWQNIRINEGLVAKDNKSPPTYNCKCNFCNNGDKDIHKNICIKLILYSIISSFVLCATYYVVIHDNINTFDEYIFSALKFLFFIGVFMGITSSISDKNINENIFKQIFNLISGIRLYVIDVSISDEKVAMNKFIKYKIKEYCENEDRRYLGCLILRIYENHFNVLLPKDSSQEIKENLNSLTMDVVKMYIEEKLTISDKLIHFFNIALVEMNIRSIHIFEFILGLNDVNKFTSSEIDGKIKTIEGFNTKNVKINGDLKNQEGNLEVLRNILTDVSIIKKDLI